MLTYAHHMGTEVGMLTGQGKPAHPTMTMEDEMSKCRTLCSDASGTCTYRCPHYERGMSSIQESRIVLLIVLGVFIILVLTGCTTVRVENWKLRTDHCKTGFIHNSESFGESDRGIATMCKWPITFLGT